MPPLDVEVQTPLGMETELLPPLFCPPVQEHLKAKVLGAQLLTLFLAGSQPEQSWKAGCFPSWPLPPTGWERKELTGECCLLRGSVFLPWKVLELLSPQGRRGVWGVVLAQITLVP